MKISNKVKKSNKAKTQSRATETIFNILGAFFIFLGILAYADTFIHGNEYQVFWICYISLILLGLGILKRNSLLIVSQINLLLITDIIWIIDFLSYFNNGQTLWGITAYMFAPRPTISNFISLQHIFSMPLALITLYKIKQKRKDAWKLSVMQFILMGTITLALTPQELNINCVFEPCVPITLEILPHQITWALAYLSIVFITNLAISSIPIFNIKKMKKLEKNKKVLLALSGGVDSSVAALLLKNKGYKVTCAFMKNFSDTKNKLTNECSWVEDYKMAQKIAAILNLPIIKLDFEKEYKMQVIDPMFNAYKKGITPNPDITCNTIIKFPLLWKHAQKIREDYIATGHYSRIKKTKRGYELLQAKDKSKDQSYFLSELSQQDLAHTLFPVGELTKTQVRTIAKRYRLPNHNRSSTKGVCFIGNIPLKYFLEQRLKQKQGQVLNENNQAIGKHKGVHYYTIGERVRPTMGINIQKQALSQKRFYIAKKDMHTNTLVVVPENHPLLKQSIFHIKKLHWINKKDKKNKLKAHVRLRHLGKLIPVILEKKNNKWQFKTLKAVQGVAPGQYAVFYNKERVICSGEIIN